MSQESTGFTGTAILFPLVIPGCAEGADPESIAPLE
jgi:hypothetical protein